MVCHVNENGKEHISCKFTDMSLYEAVMNKVQQLYGDFGVAAIRAGFSTKYCNEHTKVAVIRVRRGPHKFVASCLPCITTIDKRPVTVNTLYIGASIKQCFLFLKSYQQRQFDIYCKTLVTDDEKLALKDAILNFDKVLAQL